MATIGKVMVPAMRRAGYPETFIAGLITAVGAIDVIIPPSIPMIVYGAAAEESVARLYAAGVVPGLMIAAMLAVYVVWRAKRENFGAGEPFQLRVFLHAFGRSLWALGAPVIILGGIYGGVFSPTEAAAVACVYAALVTTFVFRELGWRDIVAAAASTVLFTGQILIIVACAGVFAWLLTVNQVPATMTAWLQSLNVSPWMLLLAINVLLLLVGCFLDPLSAILLLSPLLVPLVKAAGIDTVHFGVVVTVNSRDRPVPPAVRDQHLRGAVGARPQAGDHLSRHHSVRDNLSRGLGADHLHTGPVADRCPLPARQRLSVRMKNHPGRRSRMRGMIGRLAAVAVGAIAASSLALTTAGAQQFTMKLSSPTINDVVHEYYKTLKTGVEARSGGRIKVEIYPANQLGQLPAVVEGVALGTIEVGSAANGFWVSLEPRFQVLDAPGLFDDVLHGYRILNDPAIRTRLATFGADKGVEILTPAIYSPLMLLSHKAIRAVADFQGQKVRTQGGAPIQVEPLKKVGVLPVSLPLGEALPAMQNRTIDGMVAAAAPFVAFKYYDIAKPMTFLPATMFAAPVVANRAFMKSLGPQLEAIVREESRKAEVLFSDWNIADIKRAEEILEEERRRDHHAPAARGQALHRSGHAGRHDAPVRQSQGQGGLPGLARRRGDLSAIGRPQSRSTAISVLITRSKRRG